MARHGAAGMAEVMEGVTRPTWHQYAACRGLGPDLFFPPDGWDVAGARQAKAVCATCDVRQTCLDDAIEHSERFGIWGGLSRKERDRVRRKKAS